MNTGRAVAVVSALLAIASLAVAWVHYEGIMAIVSFFVLVFGVLASKNCTLNTNKFILLASVASVVCTVLSVTADDYLGTTVVIAHPDGYETTYASLQEEVSVSEGDSVSAGQVIGAVGNTAFTESALGAHLHFSVAKDGAAVDPGTYLPQS